MSNSATSNQWEHFTTFGDLLKFLRRRAGLSQLELSIAVGYSGAQISRIEHNHRTPDLAYLLARFVPALGLKAEPEVVARLLALAEIDAPMRAAASRHAQPHHNLPIQLTSFIGRETEVAQVVQALSPRRLVTLTGPGGVGKTRLALQVGEEVLGDYEQGVWLVELAALSDPALVAQTVAATLGVREVAGSPILATLLAFLHERQVLMVLDNCEHLLEACARLAEALLRACPRLSLLASSREPFGMAGEAVFPVPSLPFPSPGQALSAASLTAYAAINLFADRARLVLPAYELSAQNAVAVARICQRLDGIPLAIEMAAARVNILTAEQLADRLDDAFRVLTEGSRTALPRQQTLRATIDWSYQLLSAKERRLFQRLSVFAGGCTLDAAEAICGDMTSSEDGRLLTGTANTHPSDIFAQLASLVAKSVVIADLRAAEEPRYRLLETVRQYARETLLENGEDKCLRDRHLNYWSLANFC